MVRILSWIGFGLIVYILLLGFNSEFNLNAGALAKSYLLFVGFLIVYIAFLLFKPKRLKNDKK